MKKILMAILGLTLLFGLSNFVAATPPCECGVGPQGAWDYYYNNCGHDTGSMCFSSGMHAWTSECDNCQEICDIMCDDNMSCLSDCYTSYNCGEVPEFSGLIATGLALGGAGLGFITLRRRMR